VRAVGDVYQLRRRVERVRTRVAVELSDGATLAAGAAVAVASAETATLVLYGLAADGRVPAGTWRVVVAPSGALGVVSEGDYSPA